MKSNTISEPAKLSLEKPLIAANKKLIEIYQQKIKSKIAEVWGE